MRNLFIALSLTLLCNCVTSPGNCDSTQVKVSATTKEYQPTRTLQLQAELLKEINTALVHGSIAPEAAINLRQVVNSQGEEEDRYVAAGCPVPADVARQASGYLDNIRAQLDVLVRSSPAHASSGSAELQDQVESQIDQSLRQSKISVNQAKDLKKKVDLICAEEGWYLSNDKRAIPEKIIQDDVKKLNDLDNQLKRNFVGSKTDTAL
jgi:hypothetical protein